MYVKIRYNVPYARGKSRNKYNPERTALHEFLASQNENICFEYLNVNEAVNARVAIKKYAAKARKNINITQKGNMVIIQRGDKNE